MDGWTIYWITRLDDIRSVLFGLALAGNIVGGLFFFIAIADKIDSVRRIGARVFFCALLLWPCYSLCPSTKEAALIFVLPEIATAENISSASAEAKELYGMAKEWLKREMETEGGKE